MAIAAEEGYLSAFVHLCRLFAFKALHAQISLVRPAVPTLMPLHVSKLLQDQLTMKLLLFFCISILLCSCDGFDEYLEDNDQRFEVTVLEGAYCNYITLEFQPEDAVSIKRITGQDGLTYNGLQLSKVMVHPGQRLIVEIRKLDETDSYTCPTLVPTYPAVVILSLRIIN
jgi:hypothetical protein